MKKMIFKLDCLLIMFLDLFYFEVGINLVVLSFNCFLCLYCLLELSVMIEIILSFLNFFCLCFLIVMVLLIFYWNVCFYFLLLKWIGFGLDIWVYLDLILLGFDFLIW